MLRYYEGLVPEQKLAQDSMSAVAELTVGDRPHAPVVDFGDKLDGHRDSQHATFGGVSFGSVCMLPVVSARIDPTRLALAARRGSPTMASFTFTPACASHDNDWYGSINHGESKCRSGSR